MTKLDQYVNAATRDNTRKAYQGAVRYFEVEWGGFLPAAAVAMARGINANLVHERYA